MKTAASFFMVALACVAAPSAEAAEVELPQGRIAAADCPAWVEERYRLAALIDEHDLDLGEEHARILACVEHDASRMQPEIPETWCDNVLKIHCSAIDLLTAIAELEVERCEIALEEDLGIQARQHHAWKACGESAVFDGYSVGGVSPDPDSCWATILEECGTRIDPASELSDDSLAFVDCCTAESLVADREAGRCAMLDSVFERGPCLDRPVCVNRLSGEWLSCAE